jgi:ATP-binding cassette subfamily C protein
LIHTIWGSIGLLSSRQKFAVALLAGTTLILNSLDLLAITLIGLVGALALGQELPSEVDWFDAVERDTLIIYLMVAAALAFVVKTGSGLLVARYREKFLASLEVHFSNKIARHMFSGDLSRIKAISRSKLEWAVLRSTQIAFHGVIGQALALFAEATLAVFILSLFFYTDWLSALAVLTYIAGVLLIFQLATQARVSRSGQDYSEGSVSVGQALSDTLGAYKEISVFSKMPFFLNRIAEARTQVAKAQAFHQYMQSVPRLIVEIALIVGAIGFVTFQFARTNGNPDFALISIFIVGSLRIMSSLLPLQRAFMQLRHDAAQAGSSQEMVRDSLRSDQLKSPVIQPTAVGGKQFSTNRKGLSVVIRAVSFSYRDRKNTEQALEDISLTIEPGTSVALIGPSGAGKTTLVDLILGLHEPSTGSVTCSGMPPTQLRQSIPGIMSYVPQKPGLVFGSVRNNIALGVPPSEIDEEAIWSAISIAQIEDFVRALPNGLDSSLGEHVDSLSGGQLQRIGVARALYSRPRLLVLDEATSALDAETEASITEALSALGDGTTKLVVAHRLSTIQDADLVHVIDNGRLIASGKLADLESAIPLVRRYISLMTIRK